MTSSARRSRCRTKTFKISSLLLVINPSLEKRELIELKCVYLRVEAVLLWHMRGLDARDKGQYGHGGQGCEDDPRPCACGCHLHRVLPRMDVWRGEVFQKGAPPPKNQIKKTRMQKKMGRFCRLHQTAKLCHEVSHQPVSSFTYQKSTSMLRKQGAFKRTSAGKKATQLS